jgi:hypothetical protein
MATATLPASRTSLSPTLLAGGLVASLVMAMWEMIVEAIIPNGAGFWAAPVYIAATIFRNLQAVSRPVPFDTFGVVAGLMGHMMNSVIFGVIFAWLIAPRAASLLGKIVAGIVYGIAVYLAMWFVIVPLVDPVMLNLNAFVFLLAHMMWGIALGVVTQWTSARG